VRIGREEYVQRMKKVQKLIVDNSLESFIVSSEESIYYLTGVTFKPLERPFFIILRNTGPSVLLVPALEREHLTEAPNVGEVHSYWDYPAPEGSGWFEKLQDLLKGFNNVGVEPTLTQEIAVKLSSYNVKVFPFVETVRLIKSEHEVDMLRQSAYYADIALASVIKAAYFGVSELELFSQGRNVQMQIIKDIEYDVLNTNILAGAWPAPMSAQPHSVPSVDDRLKEGPHIALTLMRVNGYSTECERTFFLEKPTKQVIEAYEVMNKARELAFRMVRPGMNCGEIDVTVKEFLTRAGYGQNLLHRTGHGFGLSAHEGPWIAEGSINTLEKNMFISIEPGIYIDGVGGIRHSDTVLVTDNGYELLTKNPTDMESLIIRSLKPLRRLKGRVMRKVMGI